MSGKNIFNSVQMTRPKVNAFDLSHDVKLSFNMGELVPIMVTECVPGDRFHISCQTLVRLAPMVAPVMHRLDATIHYFFVPNRLVWPNWEDFITNTPDELGALPAFPTRTVNAASYDRLLDWLGLPTPVGGNSEVVSAIPMAAFQMICNEYYRDQNLSPEINYELVDGSNDANGDLTQFRMRCWEHDYFTAALPFAQKGASVNLPLAGFNDVPVRLNLDTFPNPPGTTVLDGTTDLPLAGDFPLYSDPANPFTDQLFAETSLLAATSTTINDLRRAFRLQEWLEKAARGGSRYIEMIRSMFGVISSDKRLQRPEYITGIKTPIQISEVLNTTGTSELPQGNMAGHGVGFINGKYGRFYVEEHGYIIGIMSVMPKTAYQQGIPKHWLKTSDPFQYYWEQFAHIGEQEVLNKEVYAFQGSAGNDTFGYVPRYSEYKFEQNRVAGEFKTTLNHWHFGRIFGSAPSLNQQFVESDPTHRPFAVTDEDEDKLYVHHYNQVRAIRPMPKFGTPTF